MALENKLGLTNSADLAREEERLSKKKAVELFEKRFLDNLPAGKFSTLQAIHKYLFEDIYAFAESIQYSSTPKLSILSCDHFELVAVTLALSHDLMSVIS